MYCFAGTLLVTALALPVFGQNLHVGMKIGIPATEYFEVGRADFRRAFREYSAATRRYTIGASVELRLRGRLGFELDVLYKRMGYVMHDSSSNPPRPSDLTLDVKGNSWDFPLLAKYRFGGALNPYAASGVALRVIGPVRGRGAITVQDLIARTTVTTQIDTSDPTEMRNRVFSGLSFAAGVELGRNRFRVLPEFRYTGWTSNLTDAAEPLRLKNQAEFLLGFVF